MHSERIGRTHADDNIRKNERTLIAGGDHKYDIIVFYMGSYRVYGGHVDMAFCHDDAFLQFDLPFRADQSAARCALQVSGLSDHAFDAKTPGVRHRNFYLGFAPAGAQDHNTLKPSLRSGDSQAFPTGVLSGLAQLFCKSRFRTCAEEDFKVLPGDMDMPGRCFDGDSQTHGSFTPSFLPCHKF